MKNLLSSLKKDSNPGPLWFQICYNRHLRCRSLINTMSSSPSYEAIYDVRARNDSHELTAWSEIDPAHLQNWQIAFWPP